jgi:transposase-like protein
MALPQSAVSDLLEVLRTGEAVDLIRESVRTVLQELIEAEAAEFIGATRYERSESRTNERNGSRPRMLATKAGDIDLRIPKLRKGSFFPLILEPRRRIDQALYAVVMEAYVAGVSTRSVDDLVAALGIDSGISKSEVSRICAGLDEVVTAFRTRRLTTPASLTSTSMRPTCTCATAPRRWCRWPSWWRPASPPTAVVRSSGSTWATARTRCSGAASSPR